MYHSSGPNTGSNPGRGRKKIKQILCSKLLKTIKWYLFEVFLNSIFFLKYIIIRYQTCNTVQFYFGVLGVLILRKRLQEIKVKTV